VDAATSGNIDHEIGAAHAVSRGMAEAVLGHAVVHGMGKALRGRSCNHILGRNRVRGRDRGLVVWTLHLSVLATAFNALVAVFVECGEVHEDFFVFLGSKAINLRLGKLGNQPVDRFLVKFVLMVLEGENRPVSQKMSRRSALRASDLSPSSSQAV
jgi:hypothetical protein